MKLDDLIKETADDRVTRRFVRYLIAQGIIPPPHGGRGTNAEYSAEHVEGIRRYLNLRDSGLSRTEAKAAGADAPRTLKLAPGLALTVVPSLLDGPIDPDDVAEQVRRALIPLAQKETPDADSSREV